MQCFTNPFPQGPVKVALSKVRIKVRLMRKLLVYQCIFVNVRHVVFFKCCLTLYLVNYSVDLQTVSKISRKHLSCLVFIHDLDLN